MLFSDGQFYVSMWPGYGLQLLNQIPMSVLQCKNFVDVIKVPNQLTFHREIILDNLGITNSIRQMT